MRIKDRFFHLPIQYRLIMDGQSNISIVVDTGCAGIHYSEYWTAHPL